MPSPKYSKYTLVILRDEVPIVMVGIQQTHPYAEEVDVNYQDIVDLAEAHKVVVGAGHTLGFKYWKETGVLPPPRDYIDIQPTGAENGFYDEQASNLGPLD